MTLLDNIAMLGSVGASASHLPVMLKGNKVRNFAMLAPSVATFPPNHRDIILFNALEFSALCRVMGFLVSFPFLFAQMALEFVLDSYSVTSYLDSQHLAS